MTAAAYGSRLGARHARLSGTTKTISDLTFKQHMHVRLLAAWFARALLERSGPSITEGAGKTGCALHPRSRVQNCAKKRTRAYRFSGDTPAFPAQWLYGLCRALPGD